MRNFTEKKLFLTVMSASYTLRGFAQDARGAINDVLDSFTLPVFGGFMLGGIILGLIQQWDNIIDKENRGTRKEGFVALGWYVGFALLAAVVVSAVKSAIPVSACRYEIQDQKRTGEPLHDTGASFRGLLDIRRLLFRRFRPVLPRHPCGDIRRQLEPAGPGARHLAAHPAAASIQAEKKGTAPKVQGDGKRDKHQ